MPSVRVGDIDLYFEEAGGGPVVVIAQGAFASVKTASRALRPVDYAARGLRAIAYDTRGHGRSGFSTSPSDYQREQRMRDLLGLLDALDIPKAHIVGTSMGASTALMLALRHPERVDRLVLRSPPPNWDDPVVRRNLALLAGCYRWLGVAMTARVCKWVTDPKISPRLPMQLAQLSRAAALPMIRGLMSEGFYPDGLLALQVRTLIIGQEGDRSHPAATARWLHSQLRNSRLVVAQSKHHWEVDPAGVRGRIVEFLQATA